MKFDFKTMTPEQKKNVIVGGVAGAVILIALVYIIISQFGGGGGMAPEGSAVPPPTGAMTPEGTPPPPQGITPPPVGAPPAGVPPAGAPPAGVPPGQPTPDTGAAPPAAAPPAQPAPSGPAPSPNAPGTITVFGALVVTYPPGWGIGAASSGSTAVITNGKAVLEVQAPSPKATDAKSIANAAVAANAKGGAVSAQGPKTIAGFDAYYVVVKGPKGLTRITGIDAPTRVVLVEYAKGGQFAAWKSAFDNIESKLSFK